MSRPKLFRQRAKWKRMPYLHVWLRSRLKRAPMAIPDEVQVFCNREMPDQWSPIPETMR